MMRVNHLATFNTPFWRFCWLRVSFSINSAIEIWPCRVQKLVEGLKGVEVIMGDFLVLGFGDILEEAVENQQEKGP